MHAMGAKISKCYTSYKSQPKAFKQAHILYIRHTLNFFQIVRIKTKKNYALYLMKCKKKCSIKKWVLCMCTQY